MMSRPSKASACFFASRTALRATLEPSNATIQAAYGWVLFNLGQTEAAQESVQLALSLEPDNPRALYYLGLIAQMQGRRDEAISALLRLLDHSQPQGFDVLARRALENMGFTFDRPERLK